MALEKPWSRDHWIAACQMVSSTFSSSSSSSLSGGGGIAKSRKHFPFLQQLLHSQQLRMDDQQLDLLHDCVLTALNQQGWTPDHRIFSLLLQHACRYNHPDRAHVYLQHHIHLFRRGGPFPPSIIPPNQGDFQKLVHRWSKQRGAAPTSLKIQSLIEDVWLPLYRSTGFIPMLQPLEDCLVICITALSREGNAGRARALLDRLRVDIPDNGFAPCTSMFNALMHAFAQEQRLDQVQAVFHDLLHDFETSGRQARYCPDVTSFGTLMTALNKANRKHVGTNVQACRENAQTNQQLLDILLDLYHQQQSGGEQQQLGKLRPNAHVYASVMDGWAKANEPQKATDLLRLMMQRGTLPSMHNYNTVLNAWARAAATETNDTLEAAEQLEALWEEFNTAATTDQAKEEEERLHPLFEPDHFSHMARINVWERSQRFLENITNKKEKKSDSNHLSSSSSTHGRSSWTQDDWKQNNTYAAQQAKRALEDMKASSLPPLSSSSTEGDGPTQLHMYNRVLRAVARTGNLVETKRLLEELLLLTVPDSNKSNDKVRVNVVAEDVAPNVSTLNFCLVACRQYLIESSSSPEASEKTTTTTSTATETETAVFSSSPLDVAEQAERWLLELGTLPSVRPGVVAYNLVMSCWRRSQAPQALDRVWMLWERMQLKQPRQQEEQSRRMDGAAVLPPSPPHHPRLFPNTTTYNEVMHCILHSHKSDDEKRQWLHRILQRLHADGRCLDPETNALHRQVQEFLQQ